MTKSTLHAVSEPVPGADPLHDLIRKKVLDLISKALEAELTVRLDRYADLETEGARHAVVRSVSTGDFQEPWLPWWASGPRDCRPTQYRA